MKYRDKRDGQVMFLTVVVLGAVVASVTVVAGLLMSYQIRRSADVTASTKAVFAADAGVECMLYELFGGGGGNLAECGADENSAIKLGNGAEFWITVISSYSNITLPSGESFPSVFVATGRFNNSVRSIELNLNQQN